MGFATLGATLGEMEDDVTFAGPLTCFIAMHSLLLRSFTYSFLHKTNKFISYGDFF